MDKKRLWLLYDEQDLLVNRDFIILVRKRGAELGMNIQPVTLRELQLGFNENGVPFCLRAGERSKPDGVLARMRTPLYSYHLERMGVPVFNGARVCEICNDKRRTLQFLSGLPMASTVFLSSDAFPPESYPAIVKPACGHGGDRVTLVNNLEQWREAVAAILPQPAMEQRLVGKPGHDLRIYVLFGKIIAAVMRTAKSGVISNYKLGGDVALHSLKREEEQLAQEVIQRFEEVGAPLCFAGIDLLYEPYGPVVSEIEDVVGSRMLYKVSDLDIVALFLEGVRERI